MTAPTTTTKRPGLLARAGRALRKFADTMTSASTSALPESPFTEWAFDDAERAIADAIDAQTIDVSKASSTKPRDAIAPAVGDANFPNPRAPQDPINVNRSFFNGDHWQNGAGWIGPHPAITDVAYSDAMGEIALTFTSQNVVKEVTMRHALGVVGRAWQWSFVPRRDMKDDEQPTEQEQTAIDEATALMRAWLKARNIATLMRDATATLLLSERSSIRLGIPAGLATEAADGAMIVDAKSIEDALGKVWPYHPKPDDATVVVDEDTKLECGTWLFERVDDSAAAAASSEQQRKTIDYAGLIYLDANAQTVTRLVPRTSKDDASAAAASEIESAPLDLGGRLAMFEMRRAPLITAQVQQQQRALNLALSMIPRNVVTGGFLERTMLDAQLPGEPEVDENTGIKTGRWKERPFYTGAGTVNFLVGAEYEDDEGNVTHGTPNVVYREPIKPDASIAAGDKHYKAVLDEVSQVHVLIAGDATASAISRLTARLEFLNTLLLTQPETESALRFVIETALAIGEALARHVGQYTQLLRVQVQCKLDAGPLAPDERTAIEASIGKTISRETAMLLLNVEDVDAEVARINDDPLARANLGKAVGEALQALTLAGATLDGAAAFIGITGDDLKALLTPSSFAPVVPPQVDANGNPLPPDQQPPPTNGKQPPNAPAQNAPNNGKGNSGPSNRVSNFTKPSNGKTQPARQSQSAK